MPDESVGTVQESLRELESTSDMARFVIGEGGVVSTMERVINVSLSDTP